MFKRFFTLFAAAFAAGAIIFVAAQTPVQAYAEQSEGDRQIKKYSRTFYDIFATEATISLYDYFDTEQSQNDAVAFVESVYNTLKELESKLSVSIEGSDIYNFNAAELGARVEISADTYNVLNYALSVYEETDGAYNAGVYYSVDLYGFAARSDGQKRPYDRANAGEQLPADKYVKAFKELAGSFGEVKLEQSGGSYYAVKPQKTVTVEGDDTVYDLHIDLGGIGKGYAADMVDKMLEEAGYNNSYFSFGSSSMQINGSATSADGKWELTFRDPRGNIMEYYFSTRVANSAVSTSGDYEQYYEIDGRRYCHIIDPSTGSPINNGILTATVIGGTAAEADARTTAICCMSLSEAREYINSEEVKALGLKIAFVYQNSIGWKTVYTNMADGEYTITIHNELPSWVYLLICVGVVVLACGGYAVYRAVAKRRAAKAEQAASSQAQPDGESGKEND